MLTYAAAARADASNVVSMWIVRQSGGVARFSDVRVAPAVAEPTFVRVMVVMVMVVLLS